ncbi:GspH/FimT family pseudopilin [Shewanella pneumatophori]|uniref:Type II secretion system protein H n=1 Tax=Shewanella pneumatophori TaxID=314092 RepID=A0A9X1ZFI4_9GAMM|nr:GspH/FimT family pseudopilin [Shewanella pneumatophori]MCL1138937.1 GspH/FimT family pseudopilin [Shewanella pneumatophori]
MLVKLTGFTLVELMITLAVTTILIAVSTPSLTSLYAHNRSDSNIRKIQQSVQLARNHAVAYGLRVTVCPMEAQSCSANWQNNITVFTDSGVTNRLDGVDQIIYTLGPFNPNDYIGYNRTAIRFQPEGLASGTNGTLRYCPDTQDSEYSRAVIINQSGRIRFSNKPVQCP